VLLAGFQAIPGDLLDSARLDVANPFRFFGLVVVPLARRFIVLGVVVAMTVAYLDYLAMYLETNGRITVPVLGTLVYRAQPSAPADAARPVGRGTGSRWGVERGAQRRSCPVCYGGVPGAGFFLRRIHSPPGPGPPPPASREYASSGVTRDVILGRHFGITTV